MACNNEREVTFKSLAKNEKTPLEQPGKEQQVARTSRARGEQLDVVHFSDCTSYYLPSLTGQPCCYLNMPSKLLPQALCTYCPPTLNLHILSLYLVHLD